ncbi:ATP-binding protein [Sphingomonas sp. RB3P16]|uniref:sensor histidine kinase NtrY-like n=1 Tax=Parasphingomonas frigoris TaxID=3096163 RepID=UPI002FC79CB9
MSEATPPFFLRRLRPDWLSVSPAVEIGAVTLAIGVLLFSWNIVAGTSASQRMLSPALVALMLVANLLCCGSVIVLMGRRLAKRRAVRVGAGGGAQLHVRLVATFSILASVPTVLLAVVASLLFQFGAEFWFSGSARGMLVNSRDLAQESYSQLLSYVEKETVALATDVNKMAVGQKWNPGNPEFQQLFEQSAYQRSLSAAVLFKIDAKGRLLRYAYFGLPNYDPVKNIDVSEIQQLLRGDGVSKTGTNASRTHSMTSVPGTDYLVYTERDLDAKEMTQRLAQAKSVFSDYESLLKRSQTIELRFNVALLLLSLLIIAIVVFAALAVADRLVRPVGALVSAAERVASGDLTARVPAPETDDEIGTLATAFNLMTERLQAQTSALESRRALIEAVMSGVTAGVISVASDGTIRLINSSALTLLESPDGSPVGKPLSYVSPELATLLDGKDREAIVELGAGGGEARTLAVKVTRAAEGPILTFDDITGQLLDQRRAAWSDVARRIAHEIKNPLTPIQLAAERLQRRYGKQIDPEDTTFGRLTETIIRQVGDLRRMVDEFSSFARMPKPVFRTESLVDLARQTMFLHEVAHPGITFVLTHDDPGPALVCDRRQISQALTNIVKNAVEAVEAHTETTSAEIAMTLSEGAGHVLLTVADTGIGLPANRDRIVEPYVTTRARGTGLGLAIVKKIVEEHCGTIAFDDRPGGGTIVTVRFDTALLANLDSGDGGDGGTADTPFPTLLQNRT